MTTLQTRLAQADKPSRELLEEVWEAIHGPMWKKPSGDPVWPDTFKFRRMLDAEAWTSAVEMLLPADCGKNWSIIGSDNPEGMFQAEVGVHGGEWLADASHPALALAIACLKARGLA